MTTLLITDLILDTYINKIVDVKDFLKTKNVELLHIDSIFYISPRYRIEKPIILDINKLISLKSYNLIFFNVLYEDMLYNSFNIINEEEYFNTYDEIIRILKTKCNNLVLIFPFSHSLNNESPFLYFKDEILNCYTKCYNKINTLVKNNNICLLDLYNSFNNENIFICNSELIIKDIFMVKICNFIIKIKNSKDLNNTIFYL
jgi:hypothetical protein